MTAQLLQHMQQDETAGIYMRTCQCIYCLPNLFKNDLLVSWHGGHFAIGRLHTYGRGSTTAMHHNECHPEQALVAQKCLSVCLSVPFSVPCVSTCSAGHAWGVQ